MTRHRRETKVSSVIWVVQYRLDTTRAAVVELGNTLEPNHETIPLGVNVTWGPRTKWPLSGQSLRQKDGGKGRWTDGEVGARLASLTQDLGGGDIWQPREPDRQEVRNLFDRHSDAGIWQTRTWGQWRRTQDSDSKFTTNDTEDRTLNRHLAHHSTAHACHRKRWTGDFHDCSNPFTSTSAQWMAQACTD